MEAKSKISLWDYGYILLETSADIKSYQGVFLGALQAICSLFTSSRLTFHSTQSGD